MLKPLPPIDWAVGLIDCTQFVPRDCVSAQFTTRSVAFNFEIWYALADTFTLLSTTVFCSSDSATPVQPYYSSKERTRYDFLLSFSPFPFLLLTAENAFSLAFSSGVFTSSSSSGARENRLSISSTTSTAKRTTLAAKAVPTDNLSASGNGGKEG